MLLDHRSALFVVARQQNILTTNVGSPMVSNATNSHGFRRKTAIQFTRERVVRKYVSNSTKISHEKKGTASAPTSDPGASHPTGPQPSDLKMLNRQPLDLKSAE
jgi:hypothetical protein